MTLLPVIEATPLPMLMPAAVFPLIVLPVIVTFVLPFTRTPTDVLV